jgi:hypothetical protein
MRQKLPDRRANATRKVTWTDYGGTERSILVTFGFRYAIDEFVIAEVFCADFKAGSDILGIVTDTCILVSRLFQLGERPGDLLHSMSEPYSLIGTILKAACDEDGEATHPSYQADPAHEVDDDGPDGPTPSIIAGAELLRRLYAKAKSWLH